MEATKQKRDVYAIVTEKIIEHLERGVVPWRQPWTDAGLPRNLITKRPYRGINLILLTSLGYESNLFLTYDQANKIGGRVQKGERGHLVVFWNWIEKPQEGSEDSPEKIKFPMLRYYQVFNISQCTGIPKKMLEGKIETQEYPIEACEQLVKYMPNKPQVYNNGNGAYYDVMLDIVHMPLKKSFESMEAYYCSLYHELVHSTGHFTRLNRPGIMGNAPFATEKYSFEELVAEMGACFLASHTGIVMNDFSNNAAYIDSWLQQLRNDKRLVVTAATQAQRAADFIMGIQPDTGSEESKNNGHEGGN